MCRLIKNTQWKISMQKYWYYEKCLKEILQAEVNWQQTQTQYFHKGLKGSGFVREKEWENSLFSLKYKWLKKIII
jgi:hypothetical protein